jgi:hypothetical protein
LLTILQVSCSCYKMATSWWRFTVCPLQCSGIVLHHHDGNLAYLITVKYSRLCMSLGLILWIIGTLVLGICSAVYCKKIELLKNTSK